VRRNRCRKIFAGYIGVLCLFVTAAQAEDLLISCNGQISCSFRSVSTVGVQRKDSVRLSALENAGNDVLLRKSSAVKLSSLPGLYRDVNTGVVRVLDLNSHLGDVVLPPDLPKGKSLTAASVWTGVSIEYAEVPNAKARTPLPSDQFVALLREADAETQAVRFIQTQVAVNPAQPIVDSLISGFLRFAPGSRALRSWQDQLRSEMRERLALFKAEKGDPTSLEATLDRGIAVMQVYRRIAVNNSDDDRLQAELVKERRLLTQRLTIASSLQKAGLDDAYLDKLRQLGLVSWSRPEVRSGLEKAVLTSSGVHHQISLDLRNAKHYERAVEEARLASQTLPCDQKLQDDYYLLRTEAVQEKAIPVAKEYAGEHKSRLEQIVRELAAVGEAGSLNPEREEYFRKRIADGEQLDKNYLPLLLRKAEFLKSLGEISAAREVVVRVETLVQLDLREAREWLKLDADLNTALATTRQSSEKRTSELFANAAFKDVLREAAIGLRADPENIVLLYRSALAAAILRDDVKARQFASDFLRLTSVGCSAGNYDPKLLMDLYRFHSDAPLSNQVGSIPHWISGQPYAEGDLFYDPISGGFVPHMLSSVSKETVTSLLWDGFMAVSITTARVSSQAASAGQAPAPSIPLFVAEPTYDRQRFRMTGISSRASVAQDKNVIPLHFLNSPDFDVRLAERLMGKAFPATDLKSQTRGWAGNPFFHPFLWTGIFVFDLQYDDQGRIRQAIPVNLDASRPTSAFSETLNFSWEGNSTRLLSIKGSKYSRTMTYDGKGRLVEEKISYAGGKGTIKYSYVGNSMQLRLAVCEDNFFDRTERSVLFRHLAE
jgi:hypothetical protein